MSFITNIKRFNNIEITLPLHNLTTLPLHNNLLLIPQWVLVNKNAFVKSVSVKLNKTKLCLHFY